jgi:glucose-1-phosphate thymidylyltransferase
MFLICPMAGVGSLVPPHTMNKPKTLFKIAGKRIIDHLMAKLVECFPRGTPICFIVGYKKKTLTEYLTNHWSHYFTIYYVEQKPLGFENDVPFFSGLGDAVALAGDLAAGHDCFICLGDRLPLASFKPLIDRCQREGLDGIINVRHVADPRHYGVVVLNDEGYIARVVEKPQTFIGDLAIAGAYYFSARIMPLLFDLLRQQSQEPLLEDRLHQFTDVIQKAIDAANARVGVNIMETPILDFGRSELLLEGNRTLLSLIPPEKLAEADPSRSIEESLIIPPVVLGSRVHLKRCIIGPNVSVGDNTVLTECVIADSVIGDCGTMARINTRHSVIGDYVTLEAVVKEYINIGDMSSLSSSLP